MRRLLALIIVVLPGVASATPHELPFSYPYSTLDQGSLEIEQYTDLTPVPGPPGTPTTMATTLTTEIEYGLTKRWELGLYFVGSNDTTTELANGSPAFYFNGVEERARVRLFEPNVLPIDISLYLELAEFTTEFEIEAKVNLEKHIGITRMLVNLWAEREFYYSGLGEWVLNPTAGASFEITPWFHLGFENWLHVELGAPGDSAYNPSAHDYLGPAFFFQGKKFWVTVAPYLLLDDWSHTPQSGDLYGRVWIRTIIGVEPW